MLVFIWSSKSNSQNASWSYPDIDIELFPDALGICPGGEVAVSTVYEYSSYAWKKNGVVYGTGQSVNLSEAGLYTIEIEAVIDGITCARTKEFEVIDMSDPQGIKEYLEAAGFYGVPIWREELPGLAPLTTTCSPEQIKFTENGSDYTTIESVANDVLTNFKPLADLENQAAVYSENDCLCQSGGITGFLNNFYLGDAAIWAHDWFASENVYKGISFTKSRMPYEPNLPIASQVDHFGTIHEEILQANVTAYDHARVVLSNNFMAHPIDGYELEESCSPTAEMIANSHFLTAAQIATKIPSVLTNLIFTKGSSIDPLIPGALIGLTTPTQETYQSYYRAEGKWVFNGFYNDKKSSFYESFSSDINSCNDCSLPISRIVEGCDYNDCEFETDNYTSTNFEISNIPDGGFDLLIEPCNSNWVHATISWKETKLFLLDLLCSLKSGESSVNYNEAFNGHVIFAKDIIIGKHFYDYVGITMPESGSFILLNQNLEDFSAYEMTPGFEQSLKISSIDESIRMNFFQSEKILQIPIVPPGHFYNPSFYSHCSRKNPVKPYIQSSNWANKYQNIKSCFKDSNDKKGIKNFLQPSEENLLIFVNGYRNSPKVVLEGAVEFNTPTSENAYSSCFDLFDGSTYWNDIGIQFKNAIKTDNVVYVDGHHSIGTANHKKMFGALPSFGASAYSCQIKLRNLLSLLNDALEVGDELPNPPVTCNDCILNDSPNFDGWFARWQNGKEVGKEIIEDIKNGKINVAHEIASNNEVVITGKIDVVAHSMGYAFAKGMNDKLIEHLPSGNKLGRFYVLAPENAIGISDEEFDSTDNIHLKAVLNPDDYEEVWQYGSDFINEPTCKQDGVAPQVGIRGMAFSQNKFIPKTKDYVSIRKFANAHLSGNYYWIFDLDFATKHPMAVPKERE